MEQYNAHLLKLKGDVSTQLKLVFALGDEFTGRTER